MALAPTLALTITSMFGAFWDVFYWAWFVAAAWVAFLLVFATLGMITTYVLSYVKKISAPLDFLTEMSFGAFLSIGIASVLLFASCLVNGITSDYELGVPVSEGPLSELREGSVITSGHLLN